MNRLIVIAGLLTIIAASCGQAGAAGPLSDNAFFESKVRPLLAKRCYECHSNQGEHEADLYLDSKAGWSEGGKSGPALKPGDPAGSLMVKAIRYEDAKLEMPPTGKLPDDEIAILVEWIARGAFDPRVGKNAPAAKKGIDLEKGRQHWAFQLPRRTAPPPVRASSWPRGDVDRFILARLEKENLAPTADADRYALLRRATFDLHGLPPTPAEIDAFIADKSPAAFEKVVDRLLASRHFGERWGRHWFDVARYAEADEIFFIEAWRYRDYVIRSFNDDKPYDRFVVEQLAGDLLPTRDARERDELLIATGFLALGPNYVPQSGPQAFMDVIDEQIDVTTRALLATTVACARCHDHKFDPIPTVDYYALAGIFYSTEICKTAIFAKGKHTFVDLTLGQPLTGYDPSAIEQFTRLAEDKYLDGNAVVRMGWDLNKLIAAEKTAAGAEKTRIAAEIAALQARIDDRNVRGKAAKQEYAALPQLPPMAMSVRENRRGATNVQVHRRGEPENLGPEVPRGVLRVATVGTAPVIGGNQSGRLQLAQWIASPKNPLAARVYVNRVWLHLFGEGLVRTVDDFGTMGERPSHPELLDYLTLRFMDEGWSTKRLIRELMHSHIYQISVQSNPAAEEVDADNRLLWRARRRRLESEAIRDSILAFSGQLDREPHTGSLIHDLGPRSLRYDRDKITFDSNKRSVYLPQPRMVLPPLFQMFDHVDTSAVQGRRDTTTVPLQALFMLNSDFIREQSQLAAARIMSAPRFDISHPIDLVCRLAYGRPATEADQTLARNFLAEFVQTRQQGEVAETSTTAATSANKPAVKAATSLTKQERKQQRAIAQKAANVQAAAQATVQTPEDLHKAAWASYCQFVLASPEFIYIH